MRPSRYTIKDSKVLAARRKVLAEKALEAFNRYGYSEASVNDIAESAGVSVGSLYKYVESKADLLEMVLRNMHEAYDIILDKLDEEDESQPVVWMIAKYIQAMTYASETVRAGIHVAYREYGKLSKQAQKDFNERQDKLIRRIQRIIERGIVRGELECSNPRMAALNMLGSTHWWSVERWAVGGMSREQYAAEQTKLMLAMVGYHGPVPSVTVEVPAPEDGN